ncbi:hypothetical protein ACNI7E_03510 [Mycoplasmoides pneumoniae]|uniref:thermonuclease family protein n=1 Tax=Mycoplasmoides pneumoniae TaxID=2104 RepID=UPI00071B359A|nr:thermonuclease family protein [Mycoplasmoides pneumoniae]QHR04399.1 thermonuclease family protein [Mycoplasmoides pneumoniae]QHR06511.1 thermonuclease family protein [Mycoplasmoides pneumoniae]QHR12113.1 thermonuclease family protein [Mycoplasmoides pneumoniae]
MKGFSCSRQGYLTGLLLLAVAPILTACTRDYTTKNEFQLTTAQQAKLKPATIEYWRDGDTPEINYASEERRKEAEQKSKENAKKEDKKEEKKTEDSQDSSSASTQVRSSKHGLRIYGIDTPEKHVSSKGDSTGDEKIEAEKASNYAEKLIPKGSTVWVWSLNTYSYDREVGALFFKSNPKQTFFQSFEVAMVEAGHAIPIAGTGLNLIADPELSADDPLSVIGLQLANAANKAYNAKINIWSHDTDGYRSLTAVYKLRGADISWTRFLDEANGYSSASAGTGASLYQLWDQRQAKLAQKGS